MAFMSRGSMPSEGNNNIGDGGDNNFNENGYRRPYFYRRFYYYIPLDNTYVMMQMIVTFIILIVGGITFLAAYKSTIIDPIENIKKLFINAHLIVTVIFLAITFIINLSSKTESDLLKRLVLIAIVSIITMLVFLVIKLNLDTTYTEIRFEEFYTERHTNVETNEKSKIDIGITGVSIKTEKEYYIDECMKLYNIFKIKSYGTLGLHLLLNILLIYQILKVQKIQNKKEKLNKDDLILFDEEQNIKI